MTVKEIILRLKELEPTTRIRMFDCFGQMFTLGKQVDSWRGSYDKPAIRVRAFIQIDQCITADELIPILEECNGTQVVGWKGGDFTLDEDDTLFLVSDWGIAGDSTTISEVLDDGYCRIKSDAY